MSNDGNPLDLRIHMQGTRVRVWRERLRRLGYELTQTESEYFDEQLEARTLEFQRDNHLPATGIVDSRTLSVARAKTEPKGVKL
jgi:peptidoglycan hydrolase-like protein with peptidoglycan-binding domain